MLTCIFFLIFPIKISFANFPPPHYIISRQVPLSAVYHLQRCGGLWKGWAPAKQKKILSGAGSDKTEKLLKGAGSERNDFWKGAGSDKTEKILAGAGSDKTERSSVRWAEPVRHPEKWCNRLLRNSVPWKQQLFTSPARRWVFIFQFRGFPLKT